jgi:hypothetical protein
MASAYRCALLVPVQDSLRREDNGRIGFRRTLLFHATRAGWRLQ